MRYGIWNNAQGWYCNTSRWFTSEKKEAENFAGYWSSETGIQWSALPIKESNETEAEADPTSVNLDDIRRALSILRANERAIEHGGSLAVVIDDLEDLLPE